jgi:hypothetical protein
MGFDPLQKDSTLAGSPPLRIESAWAKKLLAPDIFFEYHPVVKKLYRCQVPMGSNNQIPHGYLLAENVVDANQAANLVRSFVQGAMVALGVNESNAEANRYTKSEGTA